MQVSTLSETKRQTKKLNDLRVDFFYIHNVYIWIIFNLSQQYENTSTAKYNNQNYLKTTCINAHFLYNTVSGASTK